MLEVVGLAASYGDSQVLFGVDLRVGASEAVSLLGRNGMGKTTTVLAIMGIVPPRAGTVVFDGIGIAGLPPFRVAQRGIGLVPEGRQIFPNLTVRENLAATAAQRNGGSRRWTLEAVLDLFRALRERQTTLGGLLSGGEQQMLAIGRALMTNPKLLILDEATEGLAPLVRAEIWRVLRQLKSAGQSILIIDKNVAQLTAFADRHYILEKGRVAWSGSSRELAGDSGLQLRYLGV
jgi:branched-chain amino acid transport system ATP-binding protein